MCHRRKELVRSLVRHGKSVNAARQALRHRRVDHSRVLEEDRSCDTLGTHWAAVGGWSYKRQGLVSDSSPDPCILVKHLVDTVRDCCELVSVSFKSVEDLNCWCVCLKSAEDSTESVKKFNSSEKCQ